jgi:cytochrome d ubiquinol oxidase subunit II
MTMLLGIAFRGVAFEFRDRSTQMRPVWDRSFFPGSLIVAFVQGAAIGMMVRAQVPSSVHSNFQQASGHRHGHLPYICGPGAVTMVRRFNRETLDTWM